MARLKSKIKASTLTEVLVALTLITLVSALFFSIIIKVGNYHSNRQKLIVHQQLLKVIHESKKYDYLNDEQIDYEGYSIDKQVSSFKDIPGTYQIIVTAYNLNEKKIMEHKAIVQKYINNWDY